MIGKCHIGDCRDILVELAESGVEVQSVVTSPPYWGLRDYGIEPSVWGGNPECLHQWTDEIKINKGGPTGDTSGLTNRAAYQARTRVADVRAGKFCLACGAWLGTLGLEPDHRLYVEHMVEIFALVWDVLAKDGTVWLNLGDSYAAGGNGGHGERRHNFHRHRPRYGADLEGVRKVAPPGLKRKDLCLIPARVAIALQEWGWYVRQDIIWHKPNPMPESCTDRCTTAHEYIFLLSKEPRYYCDMAALREPAVTADEARFDPGTDGLGSADFDTAPLTRNKRSVWTVTTQPFSDAHFATFPPALIEPCILAGSRPGEVVLDLFMGSGTTAMVCEKLNRQWVGCERNPGYLPMIERRTAQMALTL